MANLVWNSKYNAYQDGDGNLFGGSTGVPAPAGAYLIGGPQDSATAAIGTVTVPGIGPDGSAKTVAANSPEALAYAAKPSADAIWVPNSASLGGGNWGLPGQGGGGFGFLDSVMNSIGGALTTPIGQVGEELRPYAPAIIGGIAGYGALGSLGLLGGAEAAGTGAVATPVTGGTVGGWSPLTTGAAGAGTAAAAAGGAMTPAQIEAITNQAGYGTTALGGGGNAYPWSSLFDGLGSGIGNLADSIGTGLSGFGTNLADGFLSGFGSLGTNLGTGLASGMGSIGSALNNMNASQMWQAGLNTLAGQAQAEAAKEAAKTQADAQIRAAQIAADAAKFKPVGVTTGFGSSQFGFDANGNLTSAGYNLTPEMQRQRDALLGISGGMLEQFQGSQAATAGMGTAAQRAMALGNQYLATDPQAQAQKYYADQMALLSPTRAADMAKLQAEMQAQGRGGFAIGGGVGGQGAANPQLQALLNAQMQQNTQLAANATQGGMDYTKFGAGLAGTGGDLLSSMYGTQTAAFNPYKTALGGAQTIEGLGQNALGLGIDLGKTATTASTNAGKLLSGGMTDAAATMAPANAYSPWANLLAGGANALQNYQFGQ